MGADNWGICPRCVTKALQLRQAGEERLKNDYGEISQEEYLKEVQQVREPIPHKETLREDYEVGIRDGVFFVDYSGHCKECGFEHRFNREEVLDVG